MAKTQVRCYIDTKAYVTVCKYQEKWGKRNVSQTIEHIVKSWIRQDKERIRKKLLEKKEQEKKDEND